MTKWFIEVTAGVGATEYHLEEFDNFEDADNWAEETCKELLSDYGYDNDQDFFGQTDIYARGWDEDIQEYEEIIELNYSVKPYDSEEHDKYL